MPLCGKLLRCDNFLKRCTSKKIAVGRWKSQVFWSNSYRTENITSYFIQKPPCPFNFAQLWKFNTYNRQIQYNTHEYGSFSMFHYNTITHSRYNGTVCYYSYRNIVPHMHQHTYSTGPLHTKYVQRTSIMIIIRYILYSMNERMNEWNIVV